MQSYLVADIENAVTVSVKNGEMYIVCKDVPIQKLEAQDSVAHILNEMNNIIEARMDYEGIKQNQP